MNRDARAWLLSIMAAGGFVAATHAQMVPYANQGYAPPGAFGQPYYGQPYYGQPAYGQQVYGQPQRPYGQSMVGYAPYQQPAYVQPAPARTGYAQPAYGPVYPSAAPFAQPVSAPQPWPAGARPYQTAGYMPVPNVPAPTQNAEGSAPEGIQPPVNQPEGQPPLAACEVFPPAPSPPPVMGAPPSNDPPLPVQSLPPNQALVGAGATPTADGAGATAGTTSVAISQVPLVLPGLLTATNGESARPIDRVFLGYSYMDSFYIVRSQLLFADQPLNKTTIIPGFNLSRFDAGFEKTFFDGRASIYVRAPFLNATNNISGQALNGLGDVNGGVKYVLLEDAASRNLVTAGFTAAAPTGHDVQYPVAVKNITITTNANKVSTLSFNPATQVSFSTINPTFLQPWLGAQLNFGRLFIQEYLGVIVPTDNRVATFLNNDLTVGFQLYRGDYWLSYIMPTLDVQVLAPFNHRGIPPSANPQDIANTVIPNLQPSFGFNDQVVFTESVQFGLGDRTVISGGVITPVSGPRPFNLGWNFGVSVSF